MTLDEAEAATKAYQHCKSLLYAVDVVMPREDGKVRIGLGRMDGVIGVYPAAELYIDQDLVDRMLSHALSRAKTKVDNLAFSPPAP